MPGAVADRVRASSTGSTLRTYAARQRIAAFGVDHRRCAPVPRGEHQAGRRHGDCRRLRARSVASVAEEAFSGWNGSSTSPPRLRRHCRPPRLNIIPRPGAPQSELRIGAAVARNTPDYHALVAANMVLGGQFVSRINLNSGEKGPTYGAHVLRPAPPGVPSPGQRPAAATAEAIHESMAEIPVSAIRGGVGRGGRRALPPHARLCAQLRDGRAASRERHPLAYDLPDSYFDELSQSSAPDRRRCDARDAAYLDPSRLTISVVCDYGGVARPAQAESRRSPIPAADTF